GRLRLRVLSSRAPAPPIEPQQPPGRTRRAPERGSRALPRALIARLSTQPDLRARPTGAGAAFTAHDRVVHGPDRAERRAAAALHRIAASPGTRCQGTGKARDARLARPLQPSLYLSLLPRLGIIAFLL